MADANRRGQHGVADFIELECDAELRVRRERAAEDDELLSAEAG